MKNTENNNFPQTVDKALRILDALAKAEGPQGINMLVETLSFNKSTIYRLLRALMGHGFVTQNPQTSKYDLGFKVLELSHSLLKRKGVRGMARPLMEKLAQETSETVGLAILDGNEIVYLDQVDGGEVIRLEFQLGSRWPLHATAAGKACLAYMLSEQVENIFKKIELRAYTQHTSTDPEKLLNELKLVKRNGYAYNKGEFQRNIKAFGAPILNVDIKPIGAVVLAMPQERYIDDKREFYGKKVSGVGKEISKLMGA